MKRVADEPSLIKQEKKTNDQHLGERNAALPLPSRMPHPRVSLDSHMTKYRATKRPALACSLIFLSASRTTSPRRRAKGLALGQDNLDGGIQRVHGIQD